MSFAKSVVTAGILGAVLTMGVVRDAAARPQTSSSSTATVDDSTLESRIEANIKKNASLAARNVEVAVDKGIVTLHGTVRTAAEKARAAQLATIRGVTKVENELVVDAKAAKSATSKAVDATKNAAEKTADATKEAAEKTGDKAKEIAGKAADKTKEAVSTTGEAITDGWITAKVKTKFVDETLLKSSDIDVDTNNHVVTLKGTVASAAARTRAATIASGTEGVTRVVNQLVVREP